MSIDNIKNVLINFSNYDDDFEMNIIQEHDFDDLAKEIRASQWIDVEDELPDFDVPVRCLEDDCEYIGMRFYEEGLEAWYWAKLNTSHFYYGEKSKWNEFEGDDEYRPTHWQPIEPPKE